jgi:hypothetical protein
MLSTWKIVMNNQSTPITKSTADISEPFENITQYQALVGCLIYLSVVTKPDIAYAVSMISQNMQHPTQQD